MNFYKFENWKIRFSMRLNNLNKIEEGKSVSIWKTPPERYL